LLIAAVALALAHRVGVMHRDGHFDLIAQHTALPVESHASLQ
jgi:predicted nucleic acid-binding protein